MILDKLLYFSDDQAVTESVASTKSIKVGGDEIAKTLNLCFQIGTTFAGLTSVTPVVQTCDTDSGTDSDWTTLATLNTVALASLTANSRPWGFVKLPYGLKKFVRVKYTVVGTGTAGKISAFLTPSLEVE